MDSVTLITGAGGFIGGHLVAALGRQGRRVRAADLKPLDEWYQVDPQAENVIADLRLADECRRVCRGAGEVYHLAADMGGMGFIEHNKAHCMLSVLITDFLQFVVMSPEHVAPDYLELRAPDLGPVTPATRDAVLLAAARLGPTRLIDNLTLTLPH